jgi:hypothetical protein
MTGRLKIKSAQTDVSICAIVKQEDAYIEEWVAFHVVQGVSHILLIDNDYNSRLEFILSPYIKSGIVEVVRFTGVTGPQLLAYEWALKKYQDLNYKGWVAFIDADEFLFSPKGEKLPKVLSRYKKYPGVVVNWVCFGSSGWSNKPDMLGIEAYTVRGPLYHQVPYEHLYRGTTKSGLHSYIPINSHIKTIIRPSMTLSVGSNPHFFLYRKKSAVNTAGENCYDPWTNSIVLDTLRINHYWSRSLNDMKLKHARGRATGPAKREWEMMLVRDNLCSGILDFTIQIYVNSVKDLIYKFRSQYDPLFQPDIKELTF